ncbi:MAG: hypothetical protein NC397_10130 [Clostridium sp.]|nr:hypothetical protein [Clostridium sp.]
MVKNIYKIILSVSLIILALTGCSSFQMNETTTKTVTTTTTRAVTTTTKPTTTQPAIQRDDVLPNKPTFECTMNSVGGIKVLWKSKYTGEKTIKYYTVNFHLYNSVDDEAYDDIKGKCEHSVKVVGPAETGHELIVYDENLFYCSSCSKVQIDTIKFEYMDGTEDEFWYGWYSGVGYDLR